MREGRGERGLLAAGDALIFFGAVKWLLNIIDIYAQLETLVSLQRYLPFLNAVWFTPVLLLAGFVLIEISHRNRWRAQQVKPPEIFGTDSKPLSYARAQHTLWATIAPLGVAVIVASIIGLGWLWFHAPEPPSVVRAANVPPEIHYQPPPNRTKRQSSGVTIQAPVNQTTNAPCSGNSVTGNVDNSGCGTPDPYKPITTYEPNGVKRTISAGRTEVNDSLVPTFNKFVQMSAAENWLGLLVMAEQAKKTDPDWPTAYLASGMAKIYQCEPKEGRKDIDKFLSMVASAPNYAQEIEEANRARQLPDRPEYLPQCTMQR